MTEADYTIELQKRIFLDPFSLAENRSFSPIQKTFISIGIKSHNSIFQWGGIPMYLDQVRPGLSTVTEYPGNILSAQRIFTERI